MEDAKFQATVYMGSQLVTYPCGDIKYDETTRCWVLSKVQGVDAGVKNVMVPVDKTVMIIMEESKILKPNG